MGPTFDFGEALTLLKGGKSVARTGWVAGGQMLAMELPCADSKMGLPYIYIQTSHGKLVPWTPGQQDMLADDWCEIVLEPG